MWNSGQFSGGSSPSHFTNLRVNSGWCLAALLPAIQIPLFIYLFWGRISLCSTSWTGPLYVGQASLELIQLCLPLSLECWAPQCTAHIAHFVVKISDECIVIFYTHPSTHSPKLFSYIIFYHLKSCVYMCGVGICSWVQSTAETRGVNCPHG